jgi:hypothetical protein
VHAALLGVDHGVDPLGVGGANGAALWMHELCHALSGLDLSLAQSQGVALGGYV